jgi:8-oxo-(d)GTP phosphatase
VPLLLVRHASAGDRDRWAGDDSERPLDARGEKQARKLVGLLDGFAIEEIHTSPARRCLQTIAPLAEARRLEPRVRPELGEELQWTAGAELVRSLAGRDVVVCGHGGLDTSALVDPPKWRKGAVLVVDDPHPVVDVLEP